MQLWWLWCWSRCWRIVGGRGRGFQISLSCIGIGLGLGWWLCALMSWLHHLVCCGVVLWRDSCWCRRLPCRGAMFLGWTLMTSCLFSFGRWLIPVLCFHCHCWSFLVHLVWWYAGFVVVSAMGFLVLLVVWFRDWGCLVMVIGFVWWWVVILIGQGIEVWGAAVTSFLDTPNVVKTVHALLEMVVKVNLFAIWTKIFYTVYKFSTMFPFLHTSLLRTCSILECILISVMWC